MCVCVRYSKNFMSTVPVENALWWEDLEHELDEEEATIEQQRLARAHMMAPTRLARLCGRKAAEKAKANGWRTLARLRRWVLNKFRA